MEMFLSNNEIINNLCYDEAGLTFTVSVCNLPPLTVAGGDKASVLLQRKEAEIRLLYENEAPSYLSPG